ncbi:MAG: cache domain-containing protein [Bacteroidales bacterium]|nr:cache domain-containing protein [Bacteroidales bacterium]
MPKNPLNRFFLYIVLPSILAIGFFILSIFLVILPSVEKNSMEGKREMISELTNTAWSLLEEYHHEAENNILPEDSAKIMAAEKIGKIRYGDQGKDYFWIIDKHPFMIMHPYRPELILKDLNSYQDPEGKLLFVEATKTVTETGSGYIYYLWQWKDDSTRVVPKLSFVKEFQPWGWIIGTGIYLDDVHQEIKVLKNKLLRIVLLITLVIILLLALIIRQSLGIEKKREEAENKLKLSRQKYKSLVEASTEGTLMILKDEIIFSNLKFSELSGYDPFEMAKLNFGDIFTIKWEQLLNSFSDPTKSVTQETSLICKDGKKTDVVISASMVPYSEEKGYVLIVKEVKPQQMLGKEIETLTEELQTSLLSMNQLIKPFVRELKKCPADKSIREAAEIMTRKNTRIIFISQGESIIGVVNSNDLKNRVLAKGIDPERPVIEIMTAPVESISEKALLHEALLKLKNKQVSHLAILNEKHLLSGVIGYEDIIDIQHNTLGYFIKEIETAGDIHQLSKIYGACLSW